MSLYGETLKIGGVVCGLVLRGRSNGEYRAVFEREYASLEEIEAINWSPRGTASRWRTSSTAAPIGAIRWCSGWKSSIWGT